MRIATGKVVNGKIVIEGERLDEGSTVAVLVMEYGGDSFELNTKQEAELLDAMSQANKSEGIDGDEFLRQISGE